MSAGMAGDMRKMTEWGGKKAAEARPARPPPVGWVLNPRGKGFPDRANAWVKDPPYGRCVVRADPVWLLAGYGWGGRMTAGEVR